MMRLLNGTRFCVFTEPERKNYIQEEPDMAQRLQSLHDTWADKTKYVSPF